MCNDSGTEHHPTFSSAVMGLLRTKIEGGRHFESCSLNIDNATCITFVILETYTVQLCTGLQQLSKQKARLNVSQSVHIANSCKQSV